MKSSIEERFWLKVKKTNTCWLWIGAKSARYGYGEISRSRKEGPVYAHRLSYQIHKGPIPKGLYIMHSCDKALCVNPEHLSAGTQAQNMQDCRNKERMPIGSKKWNAKFNVVRVMAIRKIYSLGISQTLIERALGEPQKTINDIIKRRTWKHC